MKKTITAALAITLAIALTLTLAACGERNTDGGPPEINGIKEYSYTGLSYRFEWEEGWYDNPDAVGGCWLSFKVVGDYTGIADVLIAYGAPYDGWTAPEIQEHADYVAPIWKNENVLDNERSFDGTVADHGFPFSEDELGITGDVLVLAINQDYEVIGYILIPVTLPDAP